MYKTETPEQAETTFDIKPEKISRYFSPLPDCHGVNMTSLDK
jgi:hypothetical protein